MVGGSIRLCASVKVPSLVAIAVRWVIAGFSEHRMPIKAIAPKAAALAFIASVAIILVSAEVSWISGAL